MKKELQDQLYKKYPKIFGDHDKPMRETAMCWGIMTGDGWYWLIDHLCEAIQGYHDRNFEHSKEGIPQPVCSQVKEKFGGLRFYIWSGNDTIFGMIDFAEELSFSICEDCGSFEGKLDTINAWYSTLCSNCRAFRLNENTIRDEERLREYAKQDKV